MTSRYEVYLGSMGKLSAVNKDLLILDVSYSGLQYDRQIHTVAGLDGYDVGTIYAGKQTVTVTFELHIYDIAKRNQACQDVVAWCNNGQSLVVNDRSGQYMNVIVEEYPHIESARNWTDPLRIVFATRDIPYWRSTTKSTLTLTGKTTSGKMKVAGSYGVKTPVSVTVTAQEAVSTLTLGCWSSWLYFEGLNLAAGKTLIISYVNARYLSVKAGGVSRMNCLKAVSNDRLEAMSGAENGVQVKSNGKVTAKFSVEGLWL